MILAALAYSDNPFNPGAGLDPPYLAGRDEEIERFSQILRRMLVGKADNIIVHGLRGVGKTVLLNRFKQICISEGFLPIVRKQYSSKYSNPHLFVKTLQYDLDRALGPYSKGDRARKKLKNTAQYLRPKSVGIPGLLAYEPSYQANDNAPLEDQMLDYIVQASKIADTNNLHGIIFLLDEFHAVCNVKNHGWQVLTDLMSALNELQSQKYKCMFVLFGLPKIIANIKNARSYSERMFRSMEISNLAEIDAKNAILKPLQDTKCSFSNELISSIVSDTDRYPYFIQFFCSDIVERINKKHISLDDYVSIRDSIIKKLGEEFFMPRLKTIGGDQRKLLHSIASLNMPKIDFSSIQNITKMEKGSISQHLKRLDEKGLLYRPERGVYSFTLPMFKKYLRTMPTPDYDSV